MRDLFPIKVECYSGYKADEYPRCFYLDNNRFDVEEVIDRWYQMSASNEEEDSTSGFPASNYYKVRTRDQQVYILKHETETDLWYLWIKGESMSLR